MDFGAVGMDNGGLVCSENSNTGAAVAFAGAHQDASVAAETSKQKWYGSAAAAGFLKQERSGNNTTTTATNINTNTTTTEDDFWRALKVPKTALISDDFFSSPSSSSSSAKSILRNPLLRSNSPFLSSDNNNNNNFLSSDAHHQMLSFSSPNSSQSPLPFPYYHHPSSSSSSSIAFTARNASGYGNGGLTAGNIHGVLSGPRGPFTPSQWMELEHQALIYKYINANVPIPSYLLTPIRKALDSTGFSTFTGLRHNSFGWGAFHLGFSNSSDPEPGRCRRTDGKKWRCSRDAIADHKYCERHMNRGRHRSRKPVEGQSGHSISGTTNNTVKLMPVSSSPSAVVPGGGGASSNLGLSSQHQLKSSSVTTTSVTPRGGDNSRNFLDKENLGERYQDTTGLSIISPAIRMKENQYSISKQQNSYGESSRGEFGQVCSDSLLNPLNRSSSLVNCCNYGTSEDINERESESQRGFRQFMDDWPNSRSERSWPDVEMHSDRTQLSISIPMAASDFMSSTSSPTNEKLAASPLRLSREHDVTHIGLGLGCTADERNHRQANWIPISWESSMGGPLGEVLHNTNNGTGDGKNVSSLNLLSEGWDASPRLAASSPTGVLQKAALVSLSNSSAGSSPRADNSKTHEGASLCSGALGSTLMNPSSINH